MKSHHFYQILALLLLPILLLTGCQQKSNRTGSSSSASSTKENSSVEKTSELPKSLSLPYFSGKTLDPVTCPDGDQQTIAALIYEGLYKLDKNLNPKPCLCTGGSCDTTATTWTYSLRNGVTFSDGSALTATDCVDTLHRAMNSDRYRSRLTNVKSITAGTGTVIVSLKTPNSGFSALLDIPIVKSGTETNTVPIGTGPYLFVSDDSGAWLAINPNWWGGSSQPVKKIRLASCRDTDAARYLLTSHNIQLLTTDMTGVNPISTAGNFKFYDANTPVLQYIGINTNKKLFSSDVLRHAMWLGIDRDTMVSAYLSGHGKAAQFPVSPASKMYPSSMEENYSYNSYLSAMKDAGYTSGTVHNVTLIVNSENNFRVNVAQSIASSLSEDTDLDIQVSVLPWEQYTAALKSGKYDLYLGEVKLTADWDLQPLVGTGGTMNFSGFSDSQMDQFLFNYATAADRKGAMKSLCSYLAQKSPILPICFKSSSVVTQKGVIGNLTPSATNPFYDINTCTVHLADSQ